MGNDKNTNKKKISTYQKLILVETMEKNPGLNWSTYNPKYTAKQRGNDWNDLAKRLNQEGGAVKSVSKWQRTWTDIKLFSRKFRKADKNHSDLDCRVLALSGTKPPEVVDSKEGIIIQCAKISEDPSPNGELSPECSDLESSMDSSCLLALPESHSSSVVETRAPPVAKARIPSVVETRAAPNGEARIPPVVETRAPQEVETREPTLAENRILPEVQDKTSPPLVEDSTLPDQTVAEVVVLDSKNCEKLIAAEEASGAAMKSIALQLGQLVKLESRKATAFERTASAFERIADAVDRLSNNFCA